MKEGKQKTLSGLLRIGIVNEEPPYAEPHVRWCERSENESRKVFCNFATKVAKILRLGKKKNEFLLFCAQLFVSLQAKLH